MARLGELLTAARLIEPDKLEQALRAQVVWGGRLGTNLIELGCIDLDGLSRALARQHSLPAALARHFDKADPALQARLPADIARAYSVVPLLQIGTDRKIAVAALDPLSAFALVALADAFGVPESNIVVSIAAEMRVRYHLERVYKVARATRFLRSKGKTVTPFPQFDEFSIDTDTETSTPKITVPDGSAAPKPISDKPTGRAAVPPPPVNADDLAALIDEAIDLAIAPAPIKDEPSGRERRTYVKTLGDDDGRTPTSPIPVIPDSDPPSSPIATPRTTTASGAAVAAGPAPALGRLSLKRVAVATPADGVPDLRDANTLQEATKMIRRGGNRDRVAELAMDALSEFVPACGAALLLVIRGDAAIGWKHFCRDGEASSDVAVPLDQPGLVPRAIMHNMTARAHAADLSAIDQLLLKALGQAEGTGDLMIVPIAIGDQVMCLLAAATGTDGVAGGVEAVASATSSAFKRLIRDASR